MSERKGGYRVGPGILIPERNDGLIELYANEASGVKELIEITGGKPVHAWDEIRIHSSNELESEFKHVRKVYKGIQNVFLAKGKLTTITDGVKKGEEKEVEVIILRKKRKKM